jgi:shikimate kinase
MIGSGKTTIGNALSRELGVPMFDLDREMNARLGYSFHELVRERGWLPFRELEYAICKYFATQKNAVVCLGGGTVRYEWNRDALAGTGLVLLLEASEEELISRVKRADRPRVNPNTGLEEDIRRIWREHAETYRGAADIVYRTDRKTIAEEIVDILEIIRREPVLSALRS